MSKDRYRNRFAIHEQRLAIYERDGGICQYCGKPVAIDAFTVAHRIARVKWAIARYGADVIEHPLNKATTHSGRCNDGVLITFRPVEREELVARIRQALNASAGIDGPHIPVD